MNEITIKLCDEDRARLDRLAAALEALQPPTVVCTPPTEDEMARALAKMRDRKPKAAEPAQEATEAAETPTAPVTPPSEEKSTEEKPAPLATPETKVTLADVYAKVQTLVKSGKREETRAVVNEYAEKVSLIPLDKCAEVLNKLNALK